MKGIVKEKFGVNGTIYREDIPEPNAQYGQVKIKVHASSICGSDVHVLYDNMQVDNRYRMPVILGHEGSGEIVEVGEGVKNYKVGDRVVAETTYESCMQCENCYESYFNCCEKRVGLGSGIGGFFAEYVVVPERSVHKIPDNLSYEAAAPTEPLACAVHGVLNQSKVQPGNVVIVSGPGPIGLYASQVAKASGCVVVLTGRTSSQKRMNFAKDILGIQHTVDIKKTDLKEYIMDLTDGRGCDAYYECAGSVQAIKTGFDVLKKRGQMILIGVSLDMIEMTLGKIMYSKELTLRGVKSTTPEAWDKALRLLRYGLIDAESMISHVLPLKEWKKGYELARQHESIKVVLKP
ncbi:MAG: alcohol dehydrogenase catalytic domain-containing protein [Eubacteriales bacterium]|nr:alcohol dehydrogenase catalytic domain-containing protein [Eubacteriales bacterium]